MNPELGAEILRRKRDGDSGEVTIAYRRIPGKSPGLLFLTGYRSEMNGAKALALEAYARGTGRAYVRFDYQGHGESGGDIETCTTSTWVGDALAMLDEVCEGPQVLVGSSMGAWIMLRTALARPERVAGLIGIAAAADWTEVLLWDAFDEPTRAAILAGNALRLPSPEGGSRELVVSRAFIEDGRKHLVLGGPIPVRAPVRLLHGLSDETVPWTMSELLLAQLDSEDATLTLVKEGGHRLSKPHELGQLIGIADALCRQIERGYAPGMAASAASPSR